MPFVKIKNAGGLLTKAQHETQRVALARMTREQRDRFVKARVVMWNTETGAMVTSADGGAA